MNNLVTFEQFKTSFDRYKSIVAKFEENAFNILWIDDYYDGMLTGMLEFQNTKFRFEIISDYNVSPNQRIFAIINLTKTQIEEETYWNNIFKKYVGNHNNFDTNDKLIQQPSTMHHLFYDEYTKRPVPNYGSNTIAGWFVQK